MYTTNATTYQSGVAQSSAYRNLNKLFSRLLKDHSLTCMQWFVMGTIYDAGTEGIQQTRLSVTLQTGLPFITNTVNLLESKGMVERRGSLTDSRSKSVSVTPGFRAEFEHIEDTLAEKMSTSVYADISPKDLQIYVKVLSQLNNIKQI